MPVIVARFESSATVLLFGRVGMVSRPTINSPTSASPVRLIAHPQRPDALS
ncbi:MAG: hypothetical protein R2698_04010 [Microthrixaceae bacterium]